MLTFGLYFQIVEPYRQRSRSQSNYMYDKINGAGQRSGIFFLGWLLQTIMNHKLKETKERKKKTSGTQGTG